jgi:hypothetical protein
MRVLNNTRILFLKGLLCIVGVYSVCYMGSVRSCKGVCTACDINPSAFITRFTPALSTKLWRGLCSVGDETKHVSYG